jgi:hypothetical protein
MSIAVLTCETNKIEMLFTGIAVGETLVGGKTTMRHDLPSDALLN